MGALSTVLEQPLAQVPGTSTRPLIPQRSWALALVTVADK